MDPSNTASQFLQVGAVHIPSALDPAEIEALRAYADTDLAGRSGVRVAADTVLSSLLQAGGRIGSVAASILGQSARPVRALFFDKTAENNWVVGWHQDRTIAVRERRDVAGFGPWSVKAGIAHVEPPFSLFGQMITLRVHLDDCDEENAPLLFAPGSHKKRVVAADAADTAKRFGIRASLASAGDIWLYASGLLHASERAREPRRRRVLQIDYADADLPGGLRWQGV